MIIKQQNSKLEAQIYIAHIRIKMQGYLVNFLQQICPDIKLTSLSPLSALFENLQSIKEYNMRYFVDNIDRLASICQHYILQIQYSARYPIMLNIVEVVENMDERDPDGDSEQKIKDEMIIQTIIYAICIAMAHVGNQYYYVWLHPPENYCQTNLQQIDPDTDFMNKMGRLVARIGQKMDCNTVLHLMKPRFNRYFEQGTWKWRCAVLQCLSALSNIDQISLAQIPLLIIRQAIHDEHPKVRYLAVDCLTRIIIQFKQYFVKNHLHQILRAIMAGFKDSMNKVVSNWMLCFANLVQHHWEMLDLQPYISDTMYAIKILIHENFYNFKVCGIVAMSSLLTIPSIFCYPIFNAYTAHLYVYITEKLSLNTKQIVNRVFQFLTLFLVACPNTNQKFFENVINYIIQNEGIIQNKYFVPGWTRICLSSCYIQQNQQILPQIVVATKSNKKIHKDLNAIQCTANIFRQNLYPVTQQLLNFLIKHLEDRIHSLDLLFVKNLTKAIEKLIICCRPLYEDEGWIRDVKGFVDKLHTTGCQYFSKNMEIASFFFSLLNKIFVNYIGYYQKAQLQFTINKYYEIVKGFQHKKLQLYNSIPEHLRIDNIQWDLQYGKQYYPVQCLNKCRLQIAVVIYEIFIRTRSQIQAIQQIMNNVRQTACYSTIQNKDTSFALYFINFVLEKFNFTSLQNHWQLIHDTLIVFLASPFARIRNKAARSFGILVEKTSPNFITLDLVVRWVQAAENAYSLPKKSYQLQQNYGECKNQCVAIVGKILKNLNRQVQAKDLYQKWISQLPLKFAKKQNHLQVQFLCEVLCLYPEAVLPNWDIQYSGRLTVKIMRMLVNLLRTERKTMYSRQYSQMSIFIIQTLRRIFEWPICMQYRQDIVIEFDQYQKFYLNQIQSKGMAVL